MKMCTKRVNQYLHSFMVYNSLKQCQARTVKVKGYFRITSQTIVTRLIQSVTFKIFTVKFFIHYMHK